MGYLDHVVISNVKMVLEVLKNHDENFVSKPHSIVSKYVGFNLLNIVFASYGDHWCLLHKMYAIEVFIKVKFKNFELRWQDEVACMVENIIEYNKKRNLWKWSLFSINYLAMAFVECCWEKFTKNQIIFGKSFWWFLQLYFSACRSGRSI